MNNGVLAVTDEGKEVKIGRIDELNIVSSENLVVFDGNTDIGVEFDLNFGIFTSEKMLRMVAKIAYEWYCKENHINDCYNCFDNIIDYIMRERSCG